MADLRSSAAYRIAFVYAAAFALVFVLLGTAIYLAADADFRRQQDAGIAEESADLVRNWRAEGRPELVEAIARRGRASAGGFGYALFDRDGRRLAGALDTSRPNAGWSDIRLMDAREGPDPGRALATPMPNGELLVVAADAEPIERIDRTMLVLLAGASVLFLVVAVVGALTMGGYLRRRLARVNDTARAIVAGDMDRRIPVGARGDEFDQLAASLNAMLDRIARLVENLRQVSSDVAHDLRTPLARLRGELETAARGLTDSAACQAAFERAIERSDELLTLFAAILRIAEVEGGGLAAGFRPFDLSALLLEVCDSYAPALADGGRELRCRVIPDIHVRGDRELIAQAVINLLENAQRHTLEGTVVTLDMRVTGESVLLLVADDGPGVPAEDRDRITQRFVRLQRSRTTPGHGLGLNLVAAIAAAHGGTLRFEDNCPGLRAMIALLAIATFETWNVMPSTKGMT